jgi:hypothetical protein
LHAIEVAQKSSTLEKKNNVHEVDGKSVQVGAGGGTDITGQQFPGNLEFAPPTKRSWREC